MRKLLSIGAMRKKACNSLVVLALIVSLPPTLLCLGSVLSVEESATIATRKTLWIGESVVRLLPVAGIKMTIDGGTIEQVSGAMDSSYYPVGVDYDEIFLMAGVADKLDGRKTDAQLRKAVRKLAKKIEMKFGKRPIIIDPCELAELMLKESTPKAPDGIHLSYEGSLLVVEMAREALRAKAEK